MAKSKDIDAVVIATPLYFHPEHLAAIVAAGKHVYCEKPVGVDAAGAKRVIEIGKKAEGRLSPDVGFQIRSAPPFVELVKRIQEGALGELICGEARYYCPLPAYAGSDREGSGGFSASGAFTDNLAQADSEKQKAFIGSIVSGQFHNQAAVSRTAWRDVCVYGKKK